MSKPDSVRKAESTASAREKAAEWADAAPQRPRGSETKIALLLVVVLLGALSVVVYKKMSLKAEDVAQSRDFQPVSDGAGGAGVAADDAGAGDTAPWQSESGTATDDVSADPWNSAAGDEQSPEFAQSEPTSGEWGSSDPDSQTTMSQSEPAFAQSEPGVNGAAETSDEAWDPFDTTGSSSGADTTATAVAEHGAAEAYDPFAGDSGQTGPSGNGTSASESSDPFDAESGTNSQTESSSVAASEADGPAMELFAEESTDASAESAPALESPGESAWDLAAAPNQENGEVIEAAEATESEPLLLAPSAETAAVEADNPFESPPGLSSERRTAQLDTGSDTATLTFEPEPEPESREPADVTWSNGPGDAASANEGAFHGGSDPESDPFSTASGVSLAASEDEVSIHVVKSGDSFWTISRQHYGAGRYFNALAAYNQARIPNPQTIRPGMKVMVPDAAVLQQRYPQLTGGTYSPGQTDQSAPSGLFIERGQPMYRVGKGDTLTDIAHQHLGRASRWIQIYGMNQGQLTNGASLKTGMVLRLPADASQVTAASDGQ
jgi:nucleoid-associated protein YgaU